MEANRLKRHTFVSLATPREVASRLSLAQIRAELFGPEQIPPHRATMLLELLLAFKPPVSAEQIVIEKTQHTGRFGPTGKVWASQKSTRRLFGVGVVVEELKSISSRLMEKAMKSLASAVSA